MREITVGKNDAGQKIEVFMRKFFPSMPSSFLHKSLRKDCVKVNGRHVKEGVLLAEGDRITFYIRDEFFEKKQTYAEDFKNAKGVLRIVYEGNNILVVNKPAGLRVHDDAEHKTDTLIAQVKRYLYQKGEYDPAREHVFSPALCNRIDTNTEGLVIAAKTAEALREMNRQIRERRVHKTYLCAVLGQMPQTSGTMTGYLKKDSIQNKSEILKAEEDEAKQVTLRYRCIGAKDELSYLEIDLLTGRSHQIRAQLSTAGHPIAGDQKYGGEKKGFPHQALCAWKLKFDFPPEGILANLSGLTLKVEDPWFLKENL
jgi:23S rRNA pseudouridine955/2504/2580 synthase